MNATITVIPHRAGHSPRKWLLNLALRYVITFLYKPPRAREPVKLSNNIVRERIHISVRGSRRDERSHLIRQSLDTLPSVDHGDWVSRVIGRVVASIYTLYERCTLIMFHCLKLQLCRKTHRQTRACSATFIYNMLSWRLQCHSLTQV